ncbi:MAG: CHAT domain-containing protein [Chloroflexi bacterium]|nr:CHAT domain-containing protein [Chloroflexota bacterium]
MGAKNFLNFDVLIERTESGFRVRVFAPPLGEAGPHTFVSPLSSKELATLYSRFGRATSEPAREAHSAPDLAGDFGRRLFDAVFADEIKSLYRSSTQIAANQSAGLRIRLRLKDVPELADAPWELLHDGQDFLALSSQRALVRYLELPQAIKPLAVSPPLRALVILANPRDYEALDVTREWQQLNDALADVVSTGLFEMEWLERPTLAGLQNQLRKNEYHILHFSGHGEFDASAAADAQGALVFQDESGRGQRVSAIEFARLVRDYTPLRLVVLNACEGARASTRNAFAGVAQTLMQNSVPAVIAMQFPFTDQAAQVFANTLYGALADGFPIDAALGETRKALATQAFGLEWATPVLFTRAADGNLFDLAVLDDVKRRGLKRAALTRVAINFMDQENFARAIEYANRLLEMDTNDVAARRLRERIQRKRDLAQFYEQGKQYVEQGRWQEALDSFKQVQWRQVNYRDVASLMTNVIRALETRQSSQLPPHIDENESHYKNIVRELLRGKIVPFFGQGVNWYGRSPNESWQNAHTVPSGEELARHLAQNFDYDETDALDLIRVSQYIAVTRNMTELYDELRNIFSVEYKPAPMHRFWAELPAQLRAHGPLEFYPIVISANYDKLLEKAFDDEDEAYDSLTYLAEGEDRGKFLHRTYEGIEHLVEDASGYRKMRLDERTTIVRVHGAVSLANPAHESFVITEDHYLDLFQTDVASLLPRTVMARLKESYLVFMGCNLRNWNLRGLLYRLAKTKYRPWLVQPQIRAVDKEYWRALDVHVMDLALETFLLNVSTRLQNPAEGGAQ